VPGTRDRAKIVAATVVVASVGLDLAISLYSSLVPQEWVKKHSGPIILGTTILVLFLVFAAVITTQRSSVSDGDGASGAADRSTDSTARGSATGNAQPVHHWRRALALASILIFAFFLLKPHLPTIAWPNGAGLPSLSDSGWPAGAEAICRRGEAQAAQAIKGSSDTVAAQQLADILRRTAHDVREANPPDEVRENVNIMAGHWEAAAGNYQSISRLIGSGKTAGVDAYTGGNSSSFNYADQIANKINLYACSFTLARLSTFDTHLIFTYH
jgi:hypothetical protein